MLVLFDTAHVAVRWHPRQFFVEIEWAPVFAPSRRLRPLLAEMGEVLRGRRASRWLCDHRRLRIVGPEDLAWAAREWLPSWRDGSGCDAAIAVVQSADFFGRRSTQRFFDEVGARGHGGRIAQFEDRATAIAWLADPDMEASA